MSDDHALSAPAVIGLTGGIGSGKSLVASMLSEMGLPVLDLDRVGHQVTAPGSEGLRTLVECFGKSILDGNMLNRKRLAEICFASSEKTQALNDIIHPLIWREAERWKSEQHSRCVVIEASVLIESGSFDRVDYLVVIVADMATRRARVLKREGMSEAIFDSIVARQCDDADRLRLADDIVDNNLDVASLRRSVEALYANLTKRFGS